MNNLDIAKLLRRVAVSFQITNESRFRIIAYERAADSIEHLTRDLKDVWADGELNDIPSVGSSLVRYLDELFKSGRVKHFDSILEKVPKSIFLLLEVPGIGPKKAYKLVKILKLEHSKNIIDDIFKAAQSNKIRTIETFGEKSENDIIQNIETYKRGQIKENRISLSEADYIAQNVISHMKKIKEVQSIGELGSLRRQVATIGDLDISVATQSPDTVIEHFIAYPHQKVIEKGSSGASLLLHNGRQVDLRVQHPDSYGAMLQYFTGSKNHNIKLRSYALQNGMSLNEYGIKDVKTGKVKNFSTEEALYKHLNLPWIPPELREDKGEVEAAIREASGKHPGLPKLISEENIKGDLHIHTNYDVSSSHDVGTDDLRSYLNRARDLGYEYIGISDHNPKITNVTSKTIIQIMKKRKETYDDMYAKWVRSIDSGIVKLFIMCEVDILPDGALALPDKAMNYVDAVIVSLHSSFNQPRDQMTDRVIRALTQHPKVKFFGHPTARLLGKREGVELNWGKIFTVCQEKNIALEINANPQRLDLEDTLVFDAINTGVKLCINTDSHAVDHMNFMKHGVSVARRGWACKSDIVNTLGYNDFNQRMNGRNSRI